MRKLGVNFNHAVWQQEDMTVDKGLQLLRTVGFDSFFVGYSEDPAVMAAYAEAAARHGLCWESIHAPFRQPADVNAMWEEGEDGEAIQNALIDTVHTCARHGVRVAVVHLSSGDKAPCINDLGHRRFDRLVEAAVKENVTIGFENQRKLANLAFMFELYDDVPQVRFCWDVGHEACFTPGREYMPLFGKKLTYTHIHDNLCQYNGDLHMVPFDGAINYARTAELMNKYDYQGTLTLEIAPGKSGRYDGWTAEQFYTHAYEAAVRLRTLVDGE